MFICRSLRDFMWMPFTSMLKKIPRLAVVTAVLSTLNTAGQCDVVIGSFQGEAGWDMTNQCTDLRSKILDAANFGPAGMIPVNSVTINDYTDATVINAALLATMDILFIPWINDVQFTAAELTDIKTWVDGGTGVLLAFSDDPTHDAVSAQFGLPTVAENVDVYPNAAGSAHTLFNGCFGDVDTAFTLWNRSYFTSTVGGTILGTGPAPFNPKVVSYNAGSALFICDIDIVSNNSAYITPGSSIVFDNDRFGVNAIEWAIREVDAICAALPCGFLLSVDMLDFNAKCTGSEVEITWKTLAETNNSFFSLERSSDGINFFPVAKIDGTGSSLGEVRYSHVDQEPLNFLSYYRLAQTDQNGKTEILETATIFCEDGVPLSLFPNPATSELFVSGALNFDRIELLDYSGRTIRTIESSASSVDVSDLAEGVYFLKFYHNDGVVMLNFSKR